MEVKLYCLDVILQARWHVNTLPETTFQYSAEAEFSIKSFFCLILLLRLGQSSTIH